MTEWVRLWHDMPTDPKWRTIARKSGQSVGDVIAVFTFIMCNASGNAAERGTLSDGFSPEDVATALDVDDAAVAAIMDAMQGRVLDGRRLTGWEKRQPKREDSTAGQRKAAWKERQRNAAERKGTQGNAPDTDTDTDTEDIANAISPARAKPAADFDLFWQAYPLKKGKQAALKAWQAAKKRGATPAHIMQGLARYDWPPEARFTPHPATWLNQGRYDDEPMEMNNGHRLAANHQPQPSRRNVALDMLRDAMGGGLAAAPESDAWPPASDSGAWPALPPGSH